MKVSQNSECLLHSCFSVSGPKRRKLMKIRWHTSIWCLFFINMTTSIQCVSLTPPGIVSSTPWNTVFLTAVVGVSNLSQSLTRRKWTQEAHFSLCSLLKYSAVDVRCQNCFRHSLNHRLTKARHHNPLLIINCSWILTVHKA